jgi:hypothetical protein
MTVGFDFDGTLTNETFGNFVRLISPSLKDINKIVITTRAEIERELTDRIIELGLDNTTVYAIGDADYHNKASFVADEELELNIFFDDDLYEVEAMTRLGIVCLWIPPYDDPVMEDQYRSFIEEEYNDLFVKGMTP